MERTFALVIAPALAKMLPSSGRGGVDYRTFVIVGTVGLLIPLTCAFAGIGVIVDRTSGARRELLAAPVPRGLIVAGNLTVAVLTSALQVVVLMLAGWARGSRFDVTATGVGGSLPRCLCSPCSCTRWPRFWPTG